MMEQVERFCVEQGLLQSGLRIVAACSGGADSLAPAGKVLSADFGRAF